MGESKDRRNQPPWTASRVHPTHSFPLSRSGCHHGRLRFHFIVKLVLPLGHLIACPLVYHLIVGYRGICEVSFDVILLIECRRLE